MELNLLRTDLIQPREYQLKIAETASNKNTLVVLPTGTGKTLISVLVGTNRLEKYPDSKILITSPTRPLNAQHKKSFEKFTTIPEGEIILITGKIQPKDRGELYKKSRVIVATPQTIQNDLEDGRMNLENFSFVAFDECVSGDTKIILGDNSIREISSMLNPEFIGKMVLSFNLESGKFEPRKILRIFKIPCKKEMIKLVTENGELKVTEDHLILTLTPEGTKWIPVKELLPHDLIASIKNEPELKSEHLILDENDIIKTYKSQQRNLSEQYRKALKLREKFGYNSLKISRMLECPEERIRNWIYKPYRKPKPIRLIERMKKAGLLPLSFSNRNLTIIARLLGHVFGDGWLSCEDGEPKVVGFSGNEDDLETIKKELKYLGIKSSSKYSRDTISQIKTLEGRTLNIKGRSSSFVCSEPALCRLLYALGAPVGDKTATKIIIPKWLMKAPKRIKSEFLAAIMGSETYKLQQRKTTRIFYVLRFSFNKIKELSYNAQAYSKQLIKLFSDFGIKVTLKIKKGNIRKDGKITEKYLFTISNSNENLIKFLSEIGFRYSKTKSEGGELALTYLKLKESTKEKRKENLKFAIMLYKKGGYSLNEISTLLKIPLHTLTNWIYGKPKRVMASPKFPSFDEWLKNNSMVLNGCKWSELTKIEKIEKENFVYDIEVEKNHNFIANNFIVHNCHRAVKDYAYPYIAKKYMLQSRYPLILGLTASPGGSPERIKEICGNLFIKAVEIRTEADEDLKKYMMPVETEFIYVELPEEFTRLITLLEEALEDDLNWLKEHKYTFMHKPTKKMLLELQKKLINSYMRGSKGAYWAIVHVASAIKLEHAIELLEVQGTPFLYEFLKKVFSSNKKTDRRVASDPRVREVFKLVEELYSRVEHPKLQKILFVVKDLLKENPSAKIIVFANYRATVNKIREMLVQNSIKSEILIGQAVKNGKGMSQQQQIEILKDFKEGRFNVLVASSIGEEGVDYYADFAVFYEAVPSEIRALQRRGRVGRHAAGKIIFLITKGTLDEAYYWAAFKKEKKMKGMLYRMKEKGVKREKKSLIDWLR